MVRHLRFLCLVALLLLVIPATALADDTKEPPPISDDLVEEAPSATGGPGYLGYTYIDRNSPGGPNSDGNRFTNISATGTEITVAPDRDNGTAFLPIGFTFQFYGQARTSFIFCVNGYITFSFDTTCDAVPHNSANEPSFFIAGWWEDLDGRCAGSQFDYQVVGSAPARRLIVQWTNVGHSSLQCTTASLSTFQIVLHETSNIIEVLHSTVRTDGGTHYVEMGALTNIITLIPYNGTLTPLGNWGVMFLPSIEGFCSSPLLAIPDSPSTGIQSDLVLPPPFPYDVSDLDVFLQIPHTWLNDLDITLTHVPSGTSVRIVDNYCGSTFYDTIGGLILDDEAGIGTCNAFPAIGATGRAQPLNPLSAFDGKKMEGTWRLTVADTNGLDVGTLMHWCLVPTLVPTAVTLLSFEGRVVGDGVELTWETASEVDVLGNVRNRDKEESPPYP